jgi:hypothetical protein
VKDITGVLQIRGVAGGQETVDSVFPVSHHLGIVELGEACDAVLALVGEGGKGVGHLCVGALGGRGYADAYVGYERAWAEVDVFDEALRGLVPRHYPDLVAAVGGGEHGTFLGLYGCGIDRLGVPLGGPVALAIGAEEWEDDVVGRDKGKG